MKGCHETVPNLDLRDFEESGQTPFAFDSDFEEFKHLRSSKRAPELKNPKGHNKRRYLHQVVRA